jgi:hypothetical protein
MMGLLRGSPEQQYEFLAEVFESDPDSYERYMQTMDSEKRKAFDQKVLEIVKGKEESPVEGEEPVAEETPGEFEDEDVEPLEEFPEDISESEDEAEDEDNDKAIRSAIHGGELQMRRWSKAGPGPFAYNAPGKDDKKDYDHKERNKQPSRSRNRFTVSRMHSTSSTRDGGYVIMEIGWDPKLFEDMSPQNIQHQVISFIKGLESDKYYHDFGITGRPRITCFDQEAGIAEAKVRCSDTRGIMTVTYCTDDPEVIVPLSGIR